MAADAVPKVRATAGTNTSVEFLTLPDAVRGWCSGCRRFWEEGDSSTDGETESSKTARGTNQTGFDSCTTRCSRSSSRGIRGIHFAFPAVHRVSRLALRRTLSLLVSRVLIFVAGAGQPSLAIGHAEDEEVAAIASADSDSPVLVEVRDGQRAARGRRGDDGDETEDEELDELYVHGRCARGREVGVDGAVWNGKVSRFDARSRPASRVW